MTNLDLSSLNIRVHRSGSLLRVACLALLVVAFSISFSSQARAQQAKDDAKPTIVQPGAPGQPTQVLPATTRAKLPPLSRKDVEFMQGMIHHHAQAVEMTALINDRTTSKNVRSLGVRISHSQADEMKYMERWLQIRGEPTSMQMPGMDHAKHAAASDHSQHGQTMDHAQHSPGMDMSKHQHSMQMPGMLTQEQMDALKNAKGPEFDQLFLKGMIQHHKGALVMVDELFNTAGAGQDSEIFNFATEVDNGQRAEIKIMETMLGARP